MALIAGLGYKQNRPSQRESFRNDSMNNRQMTPYAQLNTPQSQFSSINNNYNNPNRQNQMNSFNQSQQLRNRSQHQSNLNNMNMNTNNNPYQSSSRNNKYNPYQKNQSYNNMNMNQENNNFLNNQTSSFPKSNTNSFFDQPQNNRSNPRSPNKFMSDNTSKSNINTNNKYASVAKKSMRSSGLGYVSPIPPKYSQSKSGRMPDRDRLDLTGPNTNILDPNQNQNQNQNPSMALNDNSVPISPIKPNLNSNNPYTMNNNTLPLNATSNTLNFGGASNYGGNESRLSVQQYNRDQDATHRTQIAIIGFPSGEAQFIHRKFRSYGTILKSNWSQNTLYLEYEHDQNAIRALAENAKWIKHDNLNYMIAVMYAEKTENNPFDLNLRNNNKNGNGGGRFLSFTEMYNEKFNNPDRNLPTYFGGYNNIEKPAIKRKQHIFWRIFEFITSGW